MPRSESSEGRLIRVGGDLVLAANAHDSVTVKDWLNATIFNKIELIGFVDGTTWNAATAKAV